MKSLCLYQLLESPLREGIEALCLRHRAHRVAAFGSLLTGEFGDASDVDLVVSFDDPVGESLVDQYFNFKAGLEGLFERQVDLVEVRAMPNSRLRRLIERTQVTIYGA